MSEQCKHCDTEFYFNGFELEPCDCLGAENDRLLAENAALAKALRDIANDTVGDPGAHAEKILHDWDIREEEEDE